MGMEPDIRFLQDHGTLPGEPKNPLSASEGETVTIIGNVFYGPPMEIMGEPIGYLHGKVVAEINGIRAESTEFWIPQGEQRAFSLSFTMPNRDISGSIWIESVV